MKRRGRPPKDLQPIHWVGFAEKDGWVDVWLRCGHGCRILLGYPAGHKHLAGEDAIQCHPCRKARLKGIHT